MLHNFAFKKRLHHLCAAAIAIFSYLLSGDECKAVIKTLESKSPAITPSNGQHQTAGMFCQMSRKLHKITDHRTYSSAMYFLPAGSILLFQRFLPYDSKDYMRSLSAPAPVCCSQTFPTGVFQHPCPS